MRLDAHKGSVATGTPGCCTHRERLLTFCSKQPSPFPLFGGSCKYPGGNRAIIRYWGDPPGTGGEFATEGSQPPGGCCAGEAKASVVALIIASLFAVARPHRIGGWLLFVLFCLKVASCR